MASIQTLTAAIAPFLLLSCLPTDSQLPVALSVNLGFPTQWLAYGKDGLPPLCHRVEPTVDKALWLYYPLISSRKWLELLPICTVSPRTLEKLLSTHWYRALQALVLSVSSCTWSLWNHRTQWYCYSLSRKCRLLRPVTWLRCLLSLRDQLVTE